MNSISIPALTHHLSLAPIDLFQDPQVQVSGESVGGVNTCACVNDVCRDTFGRFLTESELAPFTLEKGNENRNYLTLVLLACFVVSHEKFRGVGKELSHFLNWLTGDVRALSSIVKASDFVTDSDRREELVRKVISVLGLIPEGENSEAANDRLAAIDSILRHKVIEESKRVQERMRALREEMARKEAEEAASKMSRE